VSVFCELWITVILELRLSRCLVFLSPRVTRYGKQRREKGHMQPKAIPGRPSKQRAQVEAGMLPQLQAHDDATLEQHGDLWEQTHGERVSRWTMRAEPSSGWAGREKKVAQGHGARALEEWATWRANASKLPSESLVCIDESGSNMALTPLYARAPKGERARGSVPRNRGKHMTLIASLSLEGMGAALIPRSGRPTPQPIALYVEQVMAPSSMPGRSCSWTTSRHTKAYGSERPSRRKAVNFFS
jgi:hypothetical protein